MWKSGICPRGTTTFFPQPDVRFSTAIHSRLWRKFCTRVFHRQKFHIPQGLWRTQSVQSMRAKALCSRYTIGHSRYRSLSSKSDCLTLERNNLTPQIVKPILVTNAFATISAKLLSSSSSTTAPISYKTGFT